MRVWIDKVELEESVAKAQLDRLQVELSDILPELFDKHSAPTVPPRKTQSLRQVSDQWGRTARFPRQ